MEQTAESWEHVLALLFEDAWNEDLGRFRSRNAFRGLSDASYSLETTLMRLGGQSSLLERHLLRNFRKYAHRNVVERDSFWHWLAMAQHHGLPTRLLDWTYSPLIALHFATANIEKFETAGAIWAVNYVRIHEHLPEALHQPLENEGANIFTVEMFQGKIRDLEEIKSRFLQEFALFFEPPSIDDRIVNQHAFFSMMSDPTLPLENYLKERPGTWRKIIIPGHLKWEIRDKLDQSNITERVLFPGPDGLSRWLKRHYSPRTLRPLPRRD